MTLTLAIALIVLADVALIAGLAFVMSRAVRLTPHVPAGAAPASQRGSALAPHRSARAGRTPRSVARTLSAARS